MMAMKSNEMGDAMGAIRGKRIHFEVRVVVGAARSGGGRHGGISLK